MNKIIIDVLDKLEQNNYYAYVIGGYVRDYLMGKNNYDVDICTNALPHEIVEMFNLSDEVINYGSVSFKIAEYNFDITTFREDIKYKNRKPVEYKYVDSLEKDVIRRDFTINAIALDRNENIIDILNGVNDLKRKSIKLIGNINKLKEDPLRILRAIRFATTLDFNLDFNLKKYIMETKEYLNIISLNRIKMEIDKILLSKNCKNGLNLLKTFDLLGIVGIQYKSIVYIEDLLGMYAQLELIREYPFTKKEYEKIHKIKELLEVKVLDKYTLFKYGLDINLMVSKILKIDIKTIEDMYDKLSIKNESEIDISILEINNIINDFDKSKIIREELIKNVVNDKIENKKSILLKWVKEGKYEC